MVNGLDETDLSSAIHLLTERRLISNVVAYSHARGAACPPVSPSRSTDTRRQAAFCARLDA
jgi:hypothetical protein